MIISSPSTQHNPRLFAFGIIVAGGLFVLLLSLARVQLWRGEHFRDRGDAASIRRIRIPSARGEIVDRNGVVLAENRPSYDIVIYLEELTRGSKRQDVVRTAAATLEALSRRLGLPVTLSAQDVRIHYARRRPIPMPVWKNVPTATVAAFAERGNDLPGASLIVTPVRQYPQGALAAHVLGYVGVGSETDEAELERYYYYEPDRVGKQGVERACDEFLRGAPGGRTIRVSPGGTMAGEVGEKPAERGNRVILTLDARIQKATEEALIGAPLPAGHPMRGAAIAMDVRSGEILALASVPTFDPNLFNPGTPPDSINALMSNSNRPMINRAYGGQYAPGSTFKTVTLLAGLESGRAVMSDRSTCVGSLQIGNRAFGCWKHDGHGSVDAMTAMRQSCDVWFYQHGMATGVDTIERTARMFGLGQPTGFDIGNEFNGLVPTPAWKRKQDAKRGGGRWYDGDTAQMSIGQSFLLVTPLQMTVMAATFANGGIVMRPFVVKRVETPTGKLLRETKPEVRGRVRANSRNFETVRQSMLGAVGESDGTAHLASVNGVRVAGKTGTAEFDLYEGGTRRRIKRAWFIGFAPYDKPEVAVAVMFEDADSGGHTAAPVAGKIFASVFGKKVERVTGGGGD